MIETKIINDNPTVIYLQVPGKISKYIESRTSYLNENPEVQTLIIEDKNHAK